MSSRSGRVRPSQLPEGAVHASLEIPGRCTGCAQGAVAQGSYWRANPCFRGALGLGSAGADPPLGRSFSLPCWAGRRPPGAARSLRGGLATLPGVVSPSWDLLFPSFRSVLRFFPFSGAPPRRRSPSRAPRPGGGVPALFAPQPVRTCHLVDQAKGCWLSRPLSEGKKMAGPPFLLRIFTF